MKIGFIGCGNMASAMIGGIIKNQVVAPADILASAKTEVSREKKKEELGIAMTADNREVAAFAEVLILAVKPFYYEDVIKEISKLEYVKIKGLMQIAPFVDDPEDNRKYFRAMKQLSVDIKNKNFDNVDMSILSMGMTNDYEIAVEEGATMIRVGTAIFGERNYNI